MLSRRGEVATIGIKMFSKKKKNVKENRNRPSKEAFNLIYKKLKEDKKLISSSSKYFEYDIGFY